MFSGTLALRTFGWSLRGRSVVETRPTPLTMAIFLDHLKDQVLKYKKKKVEKSEKNYPQNQYLATPYFLLPVSCFHDFGSFL